MTVCEQFRAWALAVVRDWDGEDTAWLLAEIVRATGEGEAVFHEARVLWRYPLVPEDDE